MVHLTVVTRTDRCSGERLFFGGFFKTRGYFGGGRIPIARGQKLLCFGHFSRGDPFLLIFSKTKF